MVGLTGFIAHFTNQIDFNMKKLLIILLALIPVVGKSQYLQVPTHYDSEHTAKHIINGHVKMYLTDSTKLVVEKKKDRYAAVTPVRYYYWWTARESNSYLRRAKAACSHYH